MFAVNKASQARKPAEAKSERADSALNKKPSSENNPLWQSLALNSSGIHPKLTVGQADDPHEQEADQVADRVMRMETRQPGDSRSSFSAFTSRKAQSKRASSEEEEKELQRAEQGGNEFSSTNAPPIVHEALSATGQSLDPTTRSFMEERFARSFDDVRVHTDAQADASASAIGAFAFTSGRDIFFGSGFYRPESDSGLRLIAHELTHVAQQARGAWSPLPAAPMRVSRHDDSEEAEARTVASDVVSGYGQPRIGVEGNANAAHTLYREIAVPNPPPAATAPANVLRPDENFRWTGAVNAPVLVLRKNWLITTHHVRANTIQLTGHNYPQLFTAILSALIQRYVWAEANRAEIMRRIPELVVQLPEHWNRFDEVQINLSRTAFQIIGLPPNAPIQTYREGSGFEIYADLRTLYGADATDEAMTNLKPAIAERIITQLERAVGRSIPPAQRVASLNSLRAQLPSSRITWVLRLNESAMRYLLGGAAWDEVLGQQQEDEGGEGGAVFQVEGGGYEMPSDISVNDRETVQQLLRELFGGPATGAPPAQTPRALSHADVQALLDLARLPNRQEILNQIRQARMGSNVTGTQSVADLIEIASAQRDRLTAAQAVGYQLPQSSPDVQPPIVNRPVHGRILNESGLLVPSMEAKFEFETLDAVDALRVPYLDIQWYATRHGAAPGTTPIRSERTRYVEVRDDSIINDRDFTVTFDRPGIYDIHAFVNHNFYLPRHFEIPVEVKTEHARLQEQEATAGAGFGQAGAARQHRFSDVADQNRVVQVGLALASPVTIPLGFLRPDDSMGLRSEGTLSNETFSTPGGSLGTGRRQLQVEIEQLDRMISQYRANGSANDLIEWAQQRRERLVATRDRLDTLSGNADNKPIAVQGSYITRVPGARGGPLELVAWFTYQPNPQGGGGTYYGHLFDHSQLVRNEDFHFQESDTNYEAMMAKLFFDITRTYPNGTMSLSFQMYDGITPTRRFVRFERVTDTLLNDVRSVLFSEPVSLIVNIAATVLTVFPPTAPIGITISIAYNGANAALNMADAMRTDTVRASNYVDIGLVALDVIPLIGRATRVIRAGGTTYRVVNAAQHAGMAYMFTDGAFQQVQQLRDGMITELAQLRDEITTLERTNPSDPSLADKRRRATQLETRIRNAAAEVFTEMALHQGLTLGAMAAVGHAAEAHFENHPGARPPAPPESGQPRTTSGTPDPAHPGGAEQPRIEPGIERPGDAAVRVGGVHPASDPVLAQALPPDLQGRVAVRRGPPPDAHEVRVHYETDALGLITEIHIAAGPDALTTHIGQHVQTVRLMQRYQGVGGAIRILFERVRALVARSGRPLVPGSNLFEASLEVEKLPRIVQERAASLQREGLDPEVRRDLEADLAHLESELERHRRTVDQAEMEAGQGFVAATVPRSNAAAVATGRPQPPPGHYYYEPTPGVFELRQFAHSTNPPKRLEFRNGQWEIIDRPESPGRDFQSFLEMQRGSFAAPLDNNPHLEAALARRFGANQTDSGGAAIARRWGEALRVLYEGAGGGTAGEALLNRLLDHLGSTTTDSSYGRFRRETRRAMVEQALAQPHPANGPDQRVTRIRQLLDAVPDTRTQGEVFTQFREQLAAQQGSALSFMQPIPGAAVNLPNGRIADGAVNITAGPPGAPPPGRYLAEDKSGPGAFDPAQARRYSDQFDAHTGTIRTVDGTSHAGIVYTFDTEASARAALATIQGLHANIHVGYIGAGGTYVWLR
jgi:hypothetical protein